ncbi:MAG: alpha/beta hydrolase [Solirubrobacterales bacterium]|nr:alpha/beta hydrolase [Solirubrobacterales bacterium]
MDETVDINGLRTRYRTAGSGAPVLVLHGWGGKLEAVEPITRALSATLTVYAPDLPGFGESAVPAAPWGAGDYAGWLLGLMDALSLRRPSIVGHSNGARVAIHLAAHHPERVDKLVLVDAAGIRAKRSLGYYRRVATAKTAKHAARHLGAPGRALQERVMARVASSDYAAAGELRPTLVRLVNEDLTPLLARIAASTLLIWGERDLDTPLCDGRTMERLIPDAGLVVFPGAGHYSYLDQPRRFARVTSHFLAPPVSVPVP